MRTTWAGSGRYNRFTIGQTPRLGPGFERLSAHHHITYSKNMVKIRACAQVAVWQNFEDGREPEQVTDTNRLKYFSGLEYRDEAFSDYFADGEDTSHLVELGVTGGYIRLEFSTELNDLIAVTEYTAAAPLSTSDLETLAVYTAGQWTDGIGSNFSQSMAVATRTGIDLWPTDGDFISQTDS